jgi:hypothetical protein
MDELSAVQQLLAEPPPEPEVVEAARLRLERAAQGREPTRTRANGRGWHAPALVRRPAGRRRWSGWLAPVAAAAAVIGVIIASLAVSGVILHRPAGTGAANSSRVLAKVPPYFVAVSTIPGQEVLFGATATGAMLGRVAPPKPYNDFTLEAAAGDGRTFVLGASPRLPRGAAVDQPRPVKFYQVVVSRSGQLGRLAPLPIPPQTGVSGLAVSPDGGKLAVSFPRAGKKAPRVAVFSLATGAGRAWVWPSPGTIGHVGASFPASGLQWEADNRTLMFAVTTQTSNGWPVHLYLLDTAAPGGSLLASSHRIPLPGSELGLQHNRTQYIVGIPLITGDGSKLIAPFYRAAPAPKEFVFAITVFSVHTGKLVKVLYQRRTRTEAGSTAVYWVNASGNAAIAVRGPTFGVQTPTRFVPLPARTQRLFERPGPLGVSSLHRLPAW